MVLCAAKFNSCDEIVSGSPKEIFWSSFDMHLWTFTVDATQNIFDENVHISEEKSESVKGLYFLPNKNIKYLPIELKDNFPNLVAYGANDCSLSTLRYKYFENLNKLQVLSFGTNQISSIESDTFKDLINLKFLHLNNNELQNIADHTFDALTNLRLLTLNHNQLNILSENVFINLSQLRNISVADNELRTLSDDHFKSNNKLEYVWMDNNIFGILSSTMFDKMENLKFVNLQGNLCVNDYYYTARFSEMKTKIQTYCIAY